MAQPKLLPTAWGSNGARNDIPIERHDRLAQEAATYADGFPDITMTPISLGGKPPSGKDMNGVLHELSAHIVYQNKGQRYRFDAKHCQAIGGYPKGAVLMNDKGDTEYISLVDKNTANFNSATVNIAGKWAVLNSATQLANKADKARTVSAGAGLTGGGDLSANRTIALATPSTLSGSTKNRVGSGTTGHTHEIAKATPALAGVVRLVNNLTSGGTDAALSAEQGKLLAGRVGNISETKLGNRGSQTLNGALTVGNPNEWNKLIFPTDNGRWIFEANPKSSLGTPDSVRVNLRYVEGNQSRYISWPHVANREVVAYRSWVSSNTADAVKRATAPAGTVMYFAGQAAPNGWLKANGAAVSRTVYADLYAAIGTTYGEGDGSTTFNLPDLRGEFVRGFDDGRQVDIGRALGTWQKPTLATLEAHAVRCNRRGCN